MPRIAPVTAPDPAQADALAKAPTRPDGTVRNIFLTLAHHPMLLKRFNAFAGTFLRFGLVSPYDREVLVLRVAGRAGSRYEYGQHVQIAREAGLSDDTIRAVLLQPGAPALRAEDRLLVDVADAYLATGGLSDAHWAALARRFEDPAALNELLLTIGFYKMVADWLNTVGVELEEEPELPLDWSVL